MKHFLAPSGAVVLKMLQSVCQGQYLLKIWVDLCLSVMLVVSRDLVACFCSTLRQIDLNYSESELRQILAALLFPWVEFMSILWNTTKGTGFRSTRRSLSLLVVALSVEMIYKTPMHRLSDLAVCFCGQRRS
jgi:hypothetical protein